MSLSRPLLSILSRANILCGRFSDAIDVIRVRQRLEIRVSIDPQTFLDVKKDTCVSTSSFSMSMSPFLLCT